MTGWRRESEPACSDPSKSRGIDNTASPVEAAAVDQRRNACPVGERTVASMRHDGQEPQPRPRRGRLLLKTRPDSVSVTGRCSCFAAGEQQYLLLAGAGTAVLPLRRAKTEALRAPSRSCASRPTRWQRRRRRTVPHRRGRSGSTARATRVTCATARGSGRGAGCVIPTTWIGLWPDHDPPREGWLCTRLRRARPEAVFLAPVLDVVLSWRRPCSATSVSSSFASGPRDERRERSPRRRAP